MEKVLNGGIVIRDARTEMRAESNCPALEARDNQQSAIFNQEHAPTDRVGQAFEDKPTKADFRFGKRTYVSAGVQTDTLPYDTHTPRQSVFSIGGSSSRKDSAISTSDSGIDNGFLDIDTRNGDCIQTADPRPVSECLAIFKSDVS